MPSLAFTEHDIRMTLRQFLLTAIWCFSAIIVNAQHNHTLSGYIKDSESGETLIGANIHQEDDPTHGTITNTYGFYSITLPQGKYRFIFSYLGYQNELREINLDTNIILNVALLSGIQMKEVVISVKENAEDENVQSTSMGRVNLPTEQIKVLPALLGEVDILKTIQLLPGVSAAGEGSAGFYVRGGGADQNLVLLDEAVVYNSGHFLGFFVIRAFKDVKRRG